MGKVNSGDDGLEWDMGRWGEVVVVVRWPAEPMQQEVKGFIGPRSGRGRMKKDIRLIMSTSTRFHFRLNYLT